MSITHHVVTTKTRTLSVHVLSCDRCGAYDCAKSDDIFRHRHVYFGWGIGPDGDICPRCAGFVEGLTAPRAVCGGGER
jgi:hypothetical protein